MLPSTPIHTHNAVLGTCRLDSVNLAEVERLFSMYSEPDPESEGGEPVIADDGLTRLCSDLGVDMFTDVRAMRVVHAVHVVRVVPPLRKAAAALTRPRSPPPSSTPPPPLLGRWLCWCWRIRWAPRSLACSPRPSGWRACRTSGGSCTPSSPTLDEVVVPRDDHASRGDADAWPLHMHALCRLCHPFLSLCPSPRALSGVLARCSVDSVAKLRTKIPALRSLAQDRAFFRGFFSWLFEFSKAKVRTL